MRLNEKKFFELAKQNGFEAADLSYSHSVSTSVSIFHGEIDSFTEQESISLDARGIINGKFGAVSTEQIDKNTPQFLVDSIKSTARIIEKDEQGIIFKGSEKYHRKNVYKMTLPSHTLIIALVMMITKQVYTRQCSSDLRLNRQKKTWWFRYTLLRSALNHRVILLRQQIVKMFYELSWLFYFHAGDHEGLGKENF